ncbi:MAG TPA: hypothetical protein VF765_18255 [Polyangiaceae bacterium]
MPGSACQQAIGVSAPLVQSDQRWSNWGIIDSLSTPGGQILTQSLFQPTNPYEIASAIQQAEAAGMTVRALGSGWSFSDAVLPQPVALSPSQSVQVEMDITLSSFVPIPPQDWTVFGCAIDTSGFASSLQATLGQILLGSTDASSLFFVEAGCTLSRINDLLDAQQPPLALSTLGGSAGQTIGGAISTGTHGGDFDRPPVADSVRAIYLIGAGGVHYWVEPASRQITDPAKLMAAFTCLTSESIRYDDDLFNAVLVSMGSMGVIYAVVLDVVPQYCLMQWNSWTTWEALKQQNALNPGFQDLFDGVWSGFDAFLQATWPSDVWGTGVNRFVQVLVNPIMNDDGTHNCYVTNRVQFPVLSPIPFGNAPTAAQTSDLSSAIQNSPDFGAGPTITFGFDGAFQWLTGINLLDPGPGEVEQAQQLINFCKQYGYSWAIRSVIDAVFQKQFPLPGNPQQPYVDLGYKVMTGGPNTLNLQGQVASGEAMFPFADAVGFVDAMLAQFDAGIPQNVWPAGYLSLRACGPSAAFLAPEQFGQIDGEPQSDVTGAVEMSLLLNADSVQLMPQFEQTALNMGGILHWGQSNGLTGATNVAQSFANLDKWKLAQRLFGGDTFVNAFMTRCGLVDTGYAEGWFILLGSGAYFYGPAFPSDAASQIGAMLQAGNTLTHVRFAPNGAWMLIGSSNYRWYGAGFPADLGNAVEAGIASNSLTLVDVYVAPDGEWMIQWTQNGSGARTYQTSAGFPADIVAQVDSFDPGGSGQALVAVVFPPGGGWLGLWEQGGYFASGIPSDTFAKLEELAGDGYVFLDVVFSSADGWMIVMPENAYWANPGFDATIFQKVGELVGDGYALVDVVIPVPVSP